MKPGSMLGLSMLAMAFAMSPALASHPQQDTKEGTEHSADAGHRDCDHKTESGDADRETHADHEDDHGDDADGHDHHCGDDASH